MGWTIGMPSLKLNNVGKKSKHCGSLAGVAMEALKERKGRDPDIDPERSRLNVYGGITSAAELIEYSKKHVQELSDEQRAVGKRGIREDAVVMCSTIIKPPAEMMNALSHEEQIRFLMDAMEKLDEVIGPKNGRSYAIHFDEQGSHLHRLWEPMTKDGRLCAKDLHDIKFFGRLNREMPEFLRSRGWDIDDCNCYDAAKEDYLRQKEGGKSSMAFKAEAERTKNNLEKKISVLEQQVGSLETELKKQEKLYNELREVNEKNLQIIENNRNIINEQEETLQLIQDYDEYRSEAAQIDQDMDLLEAAAKELPEAKKLFQQAAATTWLQRMGQILLDIRRLIEAGIRRLKIFESRYVVEKRLSEPAEKRAASLDEKIFSAGKRTLPGTEGQVKEQER